MPGTRHQPHTMSTTDAEGGRASNTPRDAGLPATPGWAAQANHHGPYPEIRRLWDKSRRAGTCGPRRAVRGLGVRAPLRRPVGTDPVHPASGRLPAPHVRVHPSPYCLPPPLARLDRPQLPPLPWHLAPVALLHPCAPATPSLPPCGLTTACTCSGDLGHIPGTTVSPHEDQPTRGITHAVLGTTEPGDQP